MSTSALGVWMNGEAVGTWSVERGTPVFRYDRGWLDSPKRRSLSLSIPITATRETRGDVVANYFDNLLPDNDRIRARLARRFRTRGADAFSLLQAIGRDCVGAVQLLPPGQSPQGWDRIEAEPLDEARVAALLRAVPSDLGAGLGGDDEPFRISIAGAQEKTAFVHWQGRWCRPLGSTPTTHIVKLPLGRVGGSRRVDLSDSVHNEWLCARLIGALGLPVAATAMARFEDQTVLVVERFDRAWQDAGRWIARLPQEDLCQALGVAPSAKYEQQGGPGIARCLQLLGGSAEAARDRAAFARAQLAFWLLAATDGHAKNFSIFLMPADRYAMTPLYDVLSMWPYLGDGAHQFRRRGAALAMALRSKQAHYALDTIHARHWQQLARQVGGADTWSAMVALVERVEPALQAVQRELPADFPGLLWERVAAGMRAQAQRFHAGLAATAPAAPRST